MGGLFLAAWRLVLKRAASDRLIVGAAFVTVLLAAALLAAGPIYSEAVALSGLERTLEDAPARDSGLEVSGRIPLADASVTGDRVDKGVRDVLEVIVSSRLRGRDYRHSAVRRFHDKRRLPGNARCAFGPMVRRARVGASP